MVSEKEFNPFDILPRALMMQILLHTFSNDDINTLEIFLDYDKVSSELRTILGDETNFQYILDSLPKEFNVGLHLSLKKRITTTEEGRYRAGSALLFLKNLYSKIKPFPNDEYIKIHYDNYFASLKYIEDHLNNAPLPMYVTGYVAFYIAKRLYLTNPLDKEIHVKAFNLYLLSVHCIAQAHELQHPLARIFYSDMELQLQRNKIAFIDDNSGDADETPQIEFDELLSLLVEDIPFNVKMFSDETQTLLLVTWLKLITEDYYKARALFNFAYRNEKLLQLTEYYYSCYQINHFHRHILAYNPLFFHAKQQENILYLLQVYDVDTLVALHQGFRVYHPRPDSILLSTMLRMKKDDLKDFGSVIAEFLSLPQKGTPVWKICFHDAYRDAIDNGTIKRATTLQMKMVLRYLILVHHTRRLDEIIDRDAEILNSILYCKIDQLHKIALATIRQLMSFNVLNPLGQITHQEIILKLIYEDESHLSLLKISAPQDYDRIATIIIDNYAATIAKELANEADIGAFDYMYINQSQFRDLKQQIHTKFFDSRYLETNP